MVGNQSEVRSKESSLETIIDDIYREPEKGFFKRLKQGVEKTIAHHKNLVIMPISAIAGGGIGFIARKTVKSAIFLYNQLGRLDLAVAFANKHNIDHLAFGVLGAGVTYLLLDYCARKHIGKKIIEVDQPAEEPKQKKDNFVMRHRFLLSLPTGGVLLGLIANRFYSPLYMPLQQIKQTLLNNYKEALVSTVPVTVGVLGTFYFIYDQLGKFLGMRNKEVWKNMGMYLLYQVSKKDAIRMYENESKKGNIRAIQFLSRVKKNLDEKLELRKQVIELQEKDKAYYGDEVSWVKPYGIGSDYFSFKSKKDINILLDMAMKLYAVNPAEAIRIFDKLTQTQELGLEYKVPVTRNYFLNSQGDDKKHHWQEARTALEKAGKLTLMEGSEGRYSGFSDEFVNKNFIFKDYDEDKSNKFFIERAILEILKKQGVSVENPLYYYDEENVHKQVFIRNGEKNLREYLEDKSISERRDFFEKVLPLLMDYQQNVFSALQTEDSEFVMNTEFRGEERRVIIPVLDLDKELMRRAFLGSKPGERRLGVNEYLHPLLEKIKLFNQLNQYKPLLTFNRGDTTAANIAIADITEALCFIDPRPCIDHPLYDSVYWSGEPLWLGLNFRSRKEKSLEEALKRDRFKGMELDFSRAFDRLYLNLGLCNAGANLYLGKRELTRLILTDLREFSSGKPFEQELKDYIENCNASI